MQPKSHFIAFKWLYSVYSCKRPAEQRLRWERKEKRIPGQSITSSIVKSASEASFGLLGFRRSKIKQCAGKTIVHQNQLNGCCSTKRQRLGKECLFLTAPVTSPPPPTNSTDVAVWVLKFEKWRNNLFGKWLTIMKTYVASNKGQYCKHIAETTARDSNLWSWHFAFSFQMIFRCRKVTSGP